MLIIEHHEYTQHSRHRVSWVCLTYLSSNIVNILNMLAIKYREQCYLISGYIGKIPQQPLWLAEIIILVSSPMIVGPTIVYHFIKLYLFSSLFYNNDIFFNLLPFFSKLSPFERPYQNQKLFYQNVLQILFLGWEKIF